MFSKQVVKDHGYE